MRSTSANSQFDPIRDAVRDWAGDACFAGDLDVAIYVDGELVIDASSADPDRASPDQRSQRLMTVVGSAVKPLIGTLLLQLLAERGEDLDTPIVRYSDGLLDPTTTARHLLNHQAGLPHLRDVVREPQELTDWRYVVGLLRQLPPAWPSGARTAYHALSFGYLVGMVCECLSGETLLDALRSRILGPIGIGPEDFYLGVPPTALRSVSRLQVRGKEILSTRRAPRSVTARSLFPLTELVAFLNSTEGLAAIVPSCSAVTTAASLARFYALLSNDGRWNGATVLSPQVIEWIDERAEPRFDQVLKQRLHWNNGFVRGAGMHWLQDKDNAIGHAGFGGPMGCLLRDQRIAVGVTTTVVEADRIVGRQAEAIIGRLMGIVTDV